MLICKMVLYAYLNALCHFSGSACLIFMLIQLDWPDCLTLAVPVELLGIHGLRNPVCYFPLASPWTDSMVSWLTY